MTSNVENVSSDDVIMGRIHPRWRWHLSTPHCELKHNQSFLNLKYGKQIEPLFLFFKWNYRILAFNSKWPDHCNWCCSWQELQMTWFHAELGQQWHRCHLIVVPIHSVITHSSHYNTGHSPKCHRQQPCWLILASWRHQMETFSALLALCEGNSPVTGEFPAQWPVTRSFDVFFGLHLKKRLSKQSRRWWFETPSRSLWRHCNGLSW